MSPFLKLAVFCSGESQSKTEGAIEIVVRVQLQQNRVGNCWAWTSLRRRLSSVRSAEKGVQDRESGISCITKEAEVLFLFCDIFFVCRRELNIVFNPCVPLASSGLLYFFWCLFWEMWKFPVISSPGLSFRVAVYGLDALTVIDAGVCNVYSTWRTSHARWEQKCLFYEERLSGFLKSRFFRFCSCSYLNIIPAEGSLL